MSACRVPTISGSLSKAGCKIKAAAKRSGLFVTLIKRIKCPGNGFSFKLLQAYWPL
jgi:hypothetical protein